MENATLPLLPTSQSRPLGKDGAAARAGHRGPLPPALPAGVGVPHPRGDARARPDGGGHLPRLRPPGARPLGAGGRDQRARPPRAAARARADAERLRLPRGRGAGRGGRGGHAAALQGGETQRRHKGLSLRLSSK
eukprot:1191208-Prorocentrum_minimum.AAC.5